MRISNDNTSWKVRGVLRRDFRHTHHGPEAARRATSRKSTRRWCRGKPGRDHIIGRVAKHWHDIEREDEHGNVTTERIITRYYIGCVNCRRRDIEQFPDHVRAAWDPGFAEHLDAKQRWCTKGHLYDPSHQDPLYTYPRRIKLCVMCGYAPGAHGRYRAVVPPVEL